MKIKNLIIIILILILFLTVFTCKSIIEKLSEDTKMSDTIRVKLIFNDEKLNIPYKYHIKIKEDNGMNNVTFRRYVKSLNIYNENDKAYINGRGLNETVTIYSIKDRVITINDKDYLGIISIVPDEKGFSVYNTLPIETYLLSVLPSEMPPSFELEALKAQAVIARTYAHYFIQKNRLKNDYDVDNTYFYQVYNGFNYNFDSYYVKRVHEAVNDTQGVIVTYHNNPILAYFHSNSGGKILSGKEYFGSHSDFPYLVSKDDPYSLNFPSSNWEYAITNDEFNKIFDLKENLFEDLSSDLTENRFTDVTNDLLVDVTSDMDLTGDMIADKSDDIIQKETKKNEKIIIKDNFVEKIVVNGNELYPKEIRKKIGYSKLKSERFNIIYNKEKDEIIFKGIGYGHGVGLSQWGAQGMALKGFKYKDIIEFYYPQTEVHYYLDEIYK